MRDKLQALLKPQGSLDIKLAVIAMFLGKTCEAYAERIAVLEARQLQKGDKGDKGDSVVGPKGDRGPKGDKGDVGAVGPIGPQGKDAKPAKNGKDGVSVVDAEIAVDDHLVLKLSDGKIIDAGELPKADGTQSSSVHVSGNAYQITVSTVAPVSPQVNDLWLDIS